MSVLAVIGAQYGSEGKGAVVNALAHNFDVHVRVGGLNAGHTIYYRGQKFVMQVVPCGWVNPNATLVIGRGMLLDFNQLLFEIGDIKRRTGIDVRNRLLIDANAGVLTSAHATAEGGVDGDMHRDIGSTGKGVGVARMCRIMRDAQKFFLVKDATDQYRYVANCVVHDTAAYLNEVRKTGNKILLEGTQGSGLSLIHGPWPYVTSHDTGAAQLAADAGIPPQHVSTLLVARTYPIRVAGNSGLLKNEITWEVLSDEIGETVSEKTTVTKKIRRVGRWDNELLEKAIILNDPKFLAITFADYLDKENYGVTSWDALTIKTRRWISNLEMLHNKPVALITTGPQEGQFINRFMSEVC